MATIPDASKMFEGRKRRRLLTLGVVHHGSLGAHFDVSRQDFEDEQRAPLIAW
jgi:hypothetical protein